MALRSDIIELSLVVKDSKKVFRRLSLWFLGLGPALFGFIFYQFDMDLNIDSDETGHVGIAQFPAPRIRPQTISVISPRRNVTSTDRPTFNWVNDLFSIMQTAVLRRREFSDMNVDSPTKDY